MAEMVRVIGVEHPTNPWIDNVQSVEFKTLLDAKRRSIVPMIGVYVVGYIGLSMLAGFGREILGLKVLGSINLGFVLIAGNYVMSWMLAVVYAHISANTHDPLVKIVVDKAGQGSRP
jgi:uncharacterized membrane protein (DUF485 family)